MKNARLEAQRENASPKCATCREWDGKDTGDSAAMCQHHKVKTLDLSVCSAWELHEIHHGQIIRPDESTE